MSDERPGDAQAILLTFLPIGLAVFVVGDTLDCCLFAGAIAIFGGAEGAASGWLTPFFWRASDSELGEFVGLVLGGGTGEIGMTHTPTLTDKRKLRATMY